MQMIKLSFWLAEMDLEMSGRIKVKDLNTLLTCVICNGYHIDATTISECLHSFCKTCIVHYLQTNKFCPICEVQVHKTKPLLSIRADQTLQDIIYKVIPGLFRDEMKRRRDFYARRNFSDGATVPISSEKRGDVMGCERLIFTPEDIISISMEYCSPNLTFPILLNAENGEGFEGSVPDVVPKNKVHRRYFQCPGGVTVRHLKKLLRIKYGLAPNQEIDVMYMHDQLREEYTLTDLAYIYSWRRNGPMRLFYKFHDATCQADDILYDGPCIIPAVSEPVTAPSNRLSLSPTSSGPSEAAAPSSQSQLQRHLSPPASPQMATEPDNTKSANPKSAAMQNRFTNGLPGGDTSRMTMRSDRQERPSRMPNGTLLTKDKSSFAARHRFKPRRKSSDLGYHSSLKSHCRLGSLDSRNGKVVPRDKSVRNGFKRSTNSSYESALNGNQVSYYQKGRSGDGVHSAIPHKPMKTNAVRLPRKML